MHNRWWAATGLAACAILLAACGSTSSGSGSTSSSSSAASGSSSAVLKTATIGGATVLTDSKGFALYWFAPDSATSSKCSGACAQGWPPVIGNPSAASGVTLSGTLGTVKRSDGSLQASYNGHPLYTFAGDTGPGTASGNGVNAFGGLWHEVTSSGGAAPAASPSSSSSGGYGY